VSYETSDIDSLKKSIDLLNKRLDESQIKMSSIQTAQTEMEKSMNDLKTDISNTNTKMGEKFIEMDNMMNEFKRDNNDFAEIKTELQTVISQQSELGTKMIGCITTSKVNESLTLLENKFNELLSDQDKKSDERFNIILREVERIQGILKEENESFEKPINELNEDIKDLIILQCYKMVTNHMDPLIQREKERASHDNTITQYMKDFEASYLLIDQNIRILHENNANIRNELAGFIKSVIDNTNYINDNFSKLFSMYSMFNTPYHQPALSDPYEHTITTTSSQTNQPKKSVSFNQSKERKLFSPKPPTTILKKGAPIIANHKGAPTVANPQVGAPTITIPQVGAPTVTVSLNKN
jgi:hypothetical protein